MQIYHTDKCLEWQFKLEKEVKEFDLKYPHACKACGGAGELTYSENQSPIGSGERWMEQMTDCCSTCVEKGICPLCGTTTLYEVDNGADYDWRCDECHWSEQSSTKEVRPWEFDGDCDCYEKWLEGKKELNRNPKDPDDILEEDWLEMKEDQFNEEHGL